MPRHLEQTRRRIWQTASRLRSLAHSETLAPADLLVSERTGREGWAAREDLELRPAALGDEFGPQWATFWFRIGATVPEDWSGGAVELIWDSGCEATLWREGRVVQGLYSGWRALRTSAVVLDEARGGEELELWVEMACNSWAGDDPDPEPGVDPAIAARWRLGRNWTEPLAASAPRHIPEPARLTACAIGLTDPLARRIAADFGQLRLLEEEREAGLDRDWADELVGGLDCFCDAWDAADRSTWEPAGAILTELLARRGASPRHRVHAVGHAHIDTAWVWPVAETRRKIVRSTANQLELMDRYPEHRFAASSAQHYAWLEEDDPALFERMRERIAEGRWEVVGGSWVEPDCNLPSGEALIRQLAFGLRFLEERFGNRPAVYWSPDTFGHNGQMPQILSSCGMTGFVTQKLAWNQFTHPPHNTFRWRGIDGSEVLAHLPPVGTYNAELTPAELRASVEEFRDGDRSPRSLLLFGHGDGGGGPTTEILDRAVRCADLRGLPSVELSSATAFFSEVESDAESGELGVVSGQLYFEYHRGTYTSQARTKRGNLAAERALHDAEAAATMAWLAAGAPYPEEELADIWPTLLRNQFHDILPGTSLREVHEQTEAELAEVVATAERLRDAAVDSLAGDRTPTAEGDPSVPLNLLGHGRREVLEGSDGPALAEAPPFGFGRLADPAEADVEEVHFAADGDELLLGNGLVEARLGAGGDLLSLREAGGDRELLGAAAGFQLLEDRPTAFDAWELEPYAERSAVSVAPALGWELADGGPLRKELIFRRELSSSSSLVQRVRLDAGSRRLEIRCEVDWHERNRLLHFSLPLVVRSERATYGAQFGVHELTTHRNTDADLAHFEAPALGFTDLSEPGLGAALLSSTSYGYSAHDGTLTLSLLRAPTDPDPEADQGEHELAFAIRPHEGDWRRAGIAREALAFANPMRLVAGAVPSEPLATIDSPDLVIDTIKRSEDGEDLIVRLHEAHGSRGTARLRTSTPFVEALRTNALEEGGEPLPLGGDDTVELSYRPFEILTLRLRP
ncbi:MAG: glycoside hydrolase family 38 C-terminal domain-containing protein [Solirubrobacterales bacterium]